MQRGQQREKEDSGKTDKRSPPQSLPSQGLRLSTMKSRSALDMPSERFPSQTCACASARPISSACFFVRSGVASHARRAASSPFSRRETRAPPQSSRATYASAEDGLMHHLGIGFAVSGVAVTRKTIRMIGSSETSRHSSSETRRQRAPSRRLLALAHRGELQGEYAAKFVLRFRMVGEKGVGTVI